MPVISTPATARLLGQTCNISFAATTGWGTRPATIVLSAPNFAFNAVSGQVTNLTLSLGAMSLVWRDVIVRHVGANAPANAGIWRVTLEDRRWRWEFPTIDGDYNVVSPGELLKRERNPRQLASLLLSELGETDFDVSGLPTEPRPRKAWRAHSARDELDRLCNDYGCAVVFDGPADRVRICRVGEGAPVVDPAAYGGCVSRSDGQSIPTWPSAFRIETAHTLFQTTLLAREPIGQDTDGSIKHIDQLSYRPAGVGWARAIETDFAWLLGTYVRDGQTLYVRDLARKWVYRAWRFTGQDSLGGWSPDALVGDPQAPASLEDLGPFLNSRLERDSGSGNRLPIHVFGNFYDWRREDFKNSVNALWPFGATINNELKCLILDRPAIMFADGAFPSRAVPAALKVICGYECSHEGNPIRYKRTQTNIGPTYGAGTRVEVHDEIGREVIERTPAGAVTIDNIGSVDEECNFYLDALNAEYQLRPTSQIELPLIQRISPDGALRQVQWTGSAEGQPATTTLSYNTEVSNVTPNFRDTPQQRGRRQADQAAREREAIRLGRVKIGGGQ